MVDEGFVYAVAIDKVADTSNESNIGFRPLEPKLESGLNIVWKKHQLFSKAANVFFEKLQKNF